MLLELNVQRVSQANIITGVNLHAHVYMYMYFIIIYRRSGIFRNFIGTLRRRKLKTNIFQ